MLQRGKHLVGADRGFVKGGGLLASLFAGGFSRLIDRVDEGVTEGRIETTLPDGSFRIVGGRGDGPVAIIHLKSWRAMVRLIVSGSVGWYAAWAKGEWTSPDPVRIFELFMRNAPSLGDTGRAKGPWKAVNWLAHRLRANDKQRARRNIAHHYDLGNDFYAAWLDPSMTYSSAIFAAPGQDLQAAQEHKIHLLLDRLDLKPGQHLLEIGCGWGALAEIAARDYGVHVTGLTLSEEQKAYAEARLEQAGLADHLASERGVLFLHLLFDQGVARAPHDRAPAVFGDVVVHGLRALHFADDRRAWVALEDGAREQDHELVAPDHVAARVDHADAIGVAIEGDAQLEPVLEHRALQQLQVLGLGRIRVMGWEVAIHAAKQGQRLHTRGAKRRQGGGTARAVACIDGDAQILA